MDLNPGDSVYYSNNYALGFLIERFALRDSGRIMWRYALRSPISMANLADCRVSLREISEENLLSAIDEGRLIYYVGRGSS